MSVLDRAAHRQAHGDTFALATVVRTVSVTAAKAGAKALINPDGSIEEGWIGGGCARAAVLKAARQCMFDGQSRLVSIAPKDLLADLGVSPGEDRARRPLRQQRLPQPGHDGYFRRAGPAAAAIADPGRFAGGGRAGETGADDGLRSHGRGAGGRARPLRSLREGRGLFRAAGFGARGLRRRFHPRRRRPGRAENRRGDGSPLSRLRRIAPQGGDAARAELADEGVPAAALAAIKAPAGLDISAITTEEIALSILAEMVAVRRKPERPAMEDAIDLIAPTRSAATARSHQ